MITIQVNYFAQLREQSGISDEIICTRSRSLGQLYEELADKHAFTLPASSVRPAVNGRFVSMDDPPRDEDLVVFVPPVNGG